MQIFEAVFNRQLGPTRPVAPLTEQERARLRELVQTHAPRLRKVQFTSLEDKLQVAPLPPKHMTCSPTPHHPALSGA